MSPSSLTQTDSSPGNSSAVPPVNTAGHAPRRRLGAQRVGELHGVAERDVAELRDRDVHLLDVGRVELVGRRLRRTAERLVDRLAAGGVRAPTDGRQRRWDRLAGPERPPGGGPLTTRLTTSRTPSEARSRRTGA